MATANHERDTKVRTIELEPEERAYLENILQAELGDTRVEVRRTDTPDFQDKLHAQEELIVRLLEKVKSDATNPTQNDAGGCD